VFAKAIIRVLLQRVASEIREPYELRRVVVGAEPPTSSSMLSAAPELERFRVVIWHRAMELEK
jgi:hypothetical protein